MKQKLGILLAAAFVAGIASADTFIQPTAVTLENARASSTDPGPYLQNGTPAGSLMINGAGLIDPATVETGDLVPSDLSAITEHIAGYNAARVSRVRDTGETVDSPLGTAILTFDLGGTFELGGMVLWNNSESGNNSIGNPSTTRGWENTLVYTSSDGINFTSTGQTLSWLQSTITAVNQGTTEPVTGWITDGGPQVNYLSSGIAGVTHVRLDIDTFEGGDAIVQSMEVRFIAIPEPATLGMVSVFSGGILFIRRRFTI